MLRLWVKDNTSGAVHEYGTNRHDSLVLQEDGSLHYENIQCCAGTMFPEEGYSFCREDGTIPDVTAVDIGDEYLDIGGCYFEKPTNDEKGLVLTFDGATGYFPKEFIVEAIRAYIKQSKERDN